MPLPLAAHRVEPLGTIRLTRAALLMIDPCYVDQGAETIELWGACVPLARGQGVEVALLRGLDAAGQTTMLAGIVRGAEAEVAAKRWTDTFGVDTGRILMADAARLVDGWTSDPFQDVRVHRCRASGAILRYPYDFEDYTEALPGQEGRSMRALLDAGLWEQVREPEARSYPLSCDGAARACATPKGWGLLGRDVAASFSTPRGTGEHVVYALCDRAGRTVGVEVRLEID